MKPSLMWRSGCQIPRGIYRWDAQAGVSWMQWRNHGGRYRSVLVRPQGVSLTSSQPDGRAFPGVDDVGPDMTCHNWTSRSEGAAMVGHHDRLGLFDTDSAKSWNAAHASRAALGAATRRPCKARAAMDYSIALSSTSRQLMEPRPSISASRDMRGARACRRWRLHTPRCSCTTDVYVPAPASWTAPMRDLARADHPGDNTQRAKYLHVPDCPTAVLLGYCRVSRGGGRL